MSQYARWLWSCLLIGVTCWVLQPTQPRSVIASVLLVTIFHLNRPKD